MTAPEMLCPKCGSTWCISQAHYAIMTRRADDCRTRAKCTARPTLRHSPAPSASTTPYRTLARVARRVLLSAAMSVVPHPVDINLVRLAGQHVWAARMAPHSDGPAPHLSKNMKKLVTWVNHALAIGNGVVMDGEEEVLHRYLSRYYEILTAHIQGQHIIEILKHRLVFCRVKL